MYGAVSVYTVTIFTNQSGVNLCETLEGNHSPNLYRSVLKIFIPKNN